MKTEHNIEAYVGAIRRVDPAVHVKTLRLVSSMPVGNFNSGTETTECEITFEREEEINE